MSTVNLILVNLSRNKLRLALTVGVVGVAFFLLGLFQALDQGLSGNLRQDKTDLLISTNKHSASSPLPIKYVSQVAAIEHVADVGYADWFGGYYQEADNAVPVIAVNGQNYLNANAEIILDNTSLRNWLANPNGMLISEAMAERMNVFVGQKFALGSSIWKRSDGEQYWDFIVSGIYRLEEGAITNGTNLLMHYDYLNEVKTLRKDTVSALMIRLDDATHFKFVISQIDDFYANSDAPTKTMTLAAYAESMLSQIVNISEIVKYVMGVIFLTSVGVLAANINNSLRDRRKELALFSAVGFSQLRLYLLLTCENVLMMLMGTLAGYALAWFAVGLMAQVVELFMPAFAITSVALVTGLTIALAIAILLSLLPLVSLRTLNIAAQIKQA